MNQKDIIRMAREAGWTSYDSQDERFVTFAALVATQEREACAMLCEDSVEYAGDTLAQTIRARGQE